MTNGMDKVLDSLVQDEFVFRLEALLRDAKIEECTTDHGREFLVRNGEFSGLGGSPAVAMANMGKVALAYWLEGKSDAELAKREPAALLLN